MPQRGERDGLCDVLGRRTIPRIEAGALKDGVAYASTISSSFAATTSAPKTPQRALLTARGRDSSVRAGSAALLLESDLRPP